MTFSTSKQHAYLILAHSDFQGLNNLLKVLDHPRNDIYIHLDKRVKDCDQITLINSSFSYVCKKNILQTNT